MRSVFDLCLAAFSTSNPFLFFSFSSSFQKLLFRPQYPFFLFHLHILGVGIMLSSIVLFTWIPRGKRRSTFAWTSRVRCFYLFFFFFFFPIAQIHHVASNIVFLHMLHEVNDTLRRWSLKWQQYDNDDSWPSCPRWKTVASVHFSDAFFRAKPYGSDSPVVFFIFFFLCETVSFIIHPFLFEFVIIITYTTQDIPGLFSAVLRSMAWAVSGSCSMYISQFKLEHPNH